MNQIMKISLPYYNSVHSAWDKSTFLKGKQVLGWADNSVSGPRCYGNIIYGLILRIQRNPGTSSNLFWRPSYLAFLSKSPKIFDPFERVSGEIRSKYAPGDGI